MNRTLLLVCLCLTLGLTVWTCTTSQRRGALVVTRLRTEYRINPLGIDVTAPRLEWLLHSDKRDERQSAYRVLAASTLDSLRADQGDLWDSGKVTSDQSTQVVYQGKVLESRQTVWWKVQVWDRDGFASEWSSEAKWEMGLLGSGDWQAKWITTPAAPVVSQGLGWIWYPEGDPATAAPPGTRFFRRTFTLPRGTKIKSASCITAADDAFDLYVNGLHLGSSTSSGSLQSFDIGSLLAIGKNSVAIVAMNLAGPAGLLAQIRVETTDGGSVTVSTDGSWRTLNRPPPAGWQSSGFDDSAWATAMVAAPFGKRPWGTPAVGVGGGGPARYLRGTFGVSKAVQRARLYATALGLYEATLNGRRVGTQHFTPGWTDYRKRLQYQTYDVSSQLVPGDNVLALTIADGWYQGRVGFVGRGQYGAGPIRALAQLEVEFTDGSRQIVKTDESWTASNGPIIAADLLDGERYNARLETSGWDSPGSAADHWQPAAVVDTAAPALVAQPDDGVQVLAERSPTSATEVQPGVFIYDLGQNLVGWARLRVRGAVGSTIKLRFGEVLNPDGTLYVANLAMSL